MGDTIWVNRKNKKSEEGDDWDHTLFLEAVEELDKLADSLNVAKPSAFFDWTDYQFNMSDVGLPETWIEENQRWHTPALAIETLKALIARLEQGSEVNIGEDTREGIIEELQDCLEKLKAAEDDSDLFHFCIVM